MKIVNIENPKEWKQNNWTTYNPITGKVDYLTTYTTTKKVPETMTEAVQLAQRNNPSLRINSFKIFDKDTELIYCMEEATSKTGWYNTDTKEFISDKAMLGHFNKLDSLELKGPLFEDCGLEGKYEFNN